jgi:hypothetical protein
MTATEITIAWCKPSVFPLSARVPCSSLGEDEVLFMMFNYILSSKICLEHSMVAKKMGMSTKACVKKGRFGKAEFMIISAMQTNFRS